MSRSIPSTAVWITAVVAAVAGAGYLLVVHYRGAGPDVPAVSLTGMEPQVAEKIAAARERVRNRADSAREWGRLAKILHAHNLFEPALPCYHRAAELNPGDYRWPYLAALATARIDPARAVAGFERTLEYEPGNAAVYVSFADTLVKLGQMERAGRHYRKALELDPASTHARYGLAQLAAMENDLDSARSYLERARELAPHHGEVHALLAQVYQRAGEAELAEREQLLAEFYSITTRAPDPVAEAMEAESVDSQSYAKRGVRLANQGRYEAAERQFRQVIAIRGERSARDLANLGGALTKQGKLADAVSAYRTGLELEPDNVDALNNLGLALMQQGQLEAAARYLERAAELDPTFAEAPHNLALVRARQGRLDEAAELYQQALEVDSTYVDALVNLGTTLAQLQREDEALAHWSRALDLDSRNLLARYNLAVAQARAARHEEAIALLLGGVVIAPNSSRFALMLAWELATAPEPGLRRASEALRLAQVVYEARPDDPVAADVYAAALAENGRFEEALGVAQRGLAVANNQGAPTAALQGRIRLYLDGRPYHQLAEQPEVPNPR